MAFEKKITPFYLGASKPTERTRFFIITTGSAINYRNNTTDAEQNVDEEIFRINILLETLRGNLGSLTWSDWCGNRTKTADRTKRRPLAARAPCSWRSTLAATGNCSGRRASPVRRWRTGAGSAAAKTPPEQKEEQSISRRCWSQNQQIGPLLFHDLKQGHWLI